MPTSNHKFTAAVEGTITYLASLLYLFSYYCILLYVPSYYSTLPYRSEDNTASMHPGGGGVGAGGVGRNSQDIVGGAGGGGGGGGRGGKGGFSKRIGISRESRCGAGCGGGVGSRLPAAAALLQVVSPSREQLQQWKARSPTHSLTTPPEFLLFVLSPWKTPHPSQNNDEICTTYFFFFAGADWRTM